MSTRNEVPVDGEVRRRILARLAAAEDEHSVHILYAAESGSRARGFASPDSDYDVRFIYTHASEWYLSFDVERRRDVIEYPIVDAIDCAGWDIKKALYLFTRTNGSLLEWLKSPIQYIERGEFANRLRGLASRRIDKIALCYHYSHMARANAREYLIMDKVRLKKYLHVLRSLLAIRYLERRNDVPPVQFERLVEYAAPYEIRGAIARLLAEKRQSPELGYGQPIPELNAFIKSELGRHGEAFKGEGRPDLLEEPALREELNVIFRTAVLEAGHDAD